jgi:hypothetical protein
MSSSFLRLAQIGYALALSLVLCLLLLPSSLQAQKGFGVSTGYRATPGLPTIAIALPNLQGVGIGGAVGGAGGAAGVGGVGGVGGGAVGVSFNSQPIIQTLNLGQFFPNNGQIIGLPPPTLMPPLSNFYYGPFFVDSTTAPWATSTALGLGGGLIGGGGVGGMGGALGGAGGMGGFGGKGMGGFNGDKGL